MKGKKNKCSNFSQAPLPCRSFSIVFTNKICCIMTSFMALWPTILTDEVWIEQFYKSFPLLCLIVPFLFYFIKRTKYVKYILLPKQSTCQLWCISYCRVFDLLLVCSDTVCKICPRLSDAIFTAGRARWMTIFYVFFKGSVSMFKGWLKTILSHLFVRWLTLLTPKRQNCRYPS